jgi:putative ATPase
LETLASRVGGDARLALNSLDTAATISAGKDRQNIELGDVEEALQRRIIRYDRAGDRHYDVVSAFIKSMRGSDPDATLYWLHTMLEAGEDPRLIARRMVVFASEDVGLADSSALAIAVAAFQALEFVGLPEATYNLTHASLALALAPKSNSVTTAIASAREVVVDGPHGEVPPHLRSGSTAGDRALGHGVGYQYPHDDTRSVVEQQYLPDGLEKTILYQPKQVGDETDLADRLARIDEILGKERAPRHRRRPG